MLIHTWINFKAKIHSSHKMESGKCLSCELEVQVYDKWKLSPYQNEPPKKIRIHAVDNRLLYECN